MAADPARCVWIANYIHIERQHNEGPALRVQNSPLASDLDDLSDDCKKMDIFTGKGH
jgi:hypothetical protein